MQHLNNSNSIAMAVVKKVISGALKDILIASKILVVPILTLSGVFLALIFSNRLQDDSPFFDDGVDSTINSDGAAYYVNYKATRLITVASWTSTVIPNCATTSQ